MRMRTFILSTLFLLIFLGGSFFLKSEEIVWVVKDSTMPTARSSAQAAVAGTDIYTLGGHGGSGTYSIVNGMRENEVYHPSSDSWEQKALIPQYRGAYAFDTAVVGNKIFMFGGGNPPGTGHYDFINMYDIDSNTWTSTVAHLPYPLSGVVSVTHDGNIYVFGGRSGAESGSGQPHRKVAIKFNPNTYNYTNLSELPVYRAGGKAFIINNLIYIVGGYTATEANIPYGTIDRTPPILVYDPENDNWTEKGNVPIMGRPVIVNGTVYIIAIDLSDAYKYNISNDSWTNVTSQFPNDTTGGFRETSCVAAVGDKIYFLGGTSQTTQRLNTVIEGTIIPDATTPTVTTETISSITTTSAVCGGNVTSDGGATVTARGVCWSTSANPTTDDPRTSDGNGTGSFTSNITGLNPDTTYYVRAYATNSHGTSYGDERSFTTDPLIPTYTLNVISTPETGVDITVSPKDNGGNGNGTTNFTRTYDSGTIVTLTAPSSYNGKSFLKWLISGSANSNQTINVTMNKNHTVQAVYQSETFILTVQSSPYPGVGITVNPSDINGDGDGNTNFTRNYNWGTKVTLTAPSCVSGNSFIKWTVNGEENTNTSIQVTMESKQTAVVYYKPSEPPKIAVNRSRVNLGYIIGSSYMPKESFAIYNSGGGTLNWSASTEMNHVNLSPGSGTNYGVVDVTIDPVGLYPGKFKGVVYVSAPGASNSPMEVKINLWVKDKASSPFGEFATPLDGSTVQSSIPVTGWALGDTGIESVKIYCEEGKNLIYIGDAVFVVGARPDVEAAYPDYPMNYKAGWGYMMLTNFLPNGGNGTYQIHAIATDKEGLTTTLGIKTITVDNANAVQPFGAVDFPAQGGTASGSNYRNQGWVLTPPPNKIPENASTINVYIDGVNIGHPIYNIYRGDIAELFPDHLNKNGAHGYFDFDTTVYENGVHTIQWTARDNAGNTDGIGSRYFTIQNTGGSEECREQSAERKAAVFNVDLSMIPVEDSTPIMIKRGFNRDINSQIIHPDENGIININIKELEPVEVDLNQPCLMGFQVIGDGVSPLPIGSTLDINKGIFYWQPGPGFYGAYEFVFINSDGSDRRKMRINILPKYKLKPEAVLD